MIVYDERNTVEIGLGLEQLGAVGLFVIVLVSYSTGTATLSNHGNNSVRALSGCRHIRLSTATNFWDGPSMLREALGAWDGRAQAAIRTRPDMIPMTIAKRFMPAKI